MKAAPKEVKTPERLFKHRVVKVPCPYCSFLCSPQIKYCFKRDEHLLKLERMNEFTGTSEISDEDYTEKI